MDAESRFRGQYSGRRSGGVGEVGAVMDNHFEVRGDVALIHLRRKKGPHLLSLVSTRILPDLERLHGSFYAMWHPHPRTFYVAMDPRGRGARIHTKT